MHYSKIIKYHPSLSNQDIDYLKAFIQKKEKKRNVKYINLLKLFLERNTKSIDNNDYKDFNVNKELIDTYRNRIKTAFEKERKGFYLDKNEIKRDKQNSLFRFLNDIENFIEKTDNNGQMEIKSIKIYDEYRSKNKKIILRYIFGYLKRNKINSNITIKSIAESISTKNFLMDAGKFFEEIFIVKTSATRPNASVCFFIIETIAKEGNKNHLFYYDEAIKYHEIDKELDSKKYLGLYGTIVRKYENKENYEKFDSNADYTKIINNIISRFDMILLDIESNYENHGIEVAKYLEKAKMYFPENKFSNNSMSMIYNILKYYATNTNNFNEVEVIKQLSQKKIQKKILSLLKEKTNKI